MATADLEQRCTLPALRAATRTELLDIKDEIEKGLASVKAQLDAAAAEVAAGGEYSDPRWYARANAARRYLGQLAQRVQRVLGERRTGACSYCGRGGRAL